MMAGDAAIITVAAFPLISLSFRLCNKFGGGGNWRGLQVSQPIYQVFCTVAIGVRGCLKN